MFILIDTEVIIADDSPKSIKSQTVNGNNNGSTVCNKPNEPSSTTTGESVRVKIMRFVQFYRFHSIFFCLSFQITQVDLTISDSDEDDCVVGQSAGNNNTNIGPNKGPSATPVITNGRSR